jgi:sugar phosphate isomerase/epimerase
MQLGFVSAVLGELSFEQLLAQAAAIGYDCVEVMCWPAEGPDRKYGGVTHLDVTHFSEAQAAETHALCARYGVQISALGYYSLPISEDAAQAAAARAHLPRVIDAAARLGLSTVNTFVGAHPQQSLEENFTKFTQVWPALLRHAEQQNVRIGIENCPLLFERTRPFGLNLAQTPAIWRRMFAELGSKFFGLNYDPSHLVLQGLDPIAPIEEFGPRIFHAHAKDMTLDRRALQQAGPGALASQFATPELPGQGEIDWGAWIAALRQAGYDGPVCVEIEAKAYTGSLARRVEALQVSYDLLRPLLAW